MLSHLFRWPNSRAALPELGVSCYSANMLPLARTIEHTGLKPSLTVSEVHQLCAEALEFEFWAVCVNPYWVRTAASALSGSTTCVVSVVGFPLGATTPEVVAYEASQALDHGATEIDMVIPVGLARASDWNGLNAHIQKVRASTQGAVLKVILETGYFEPTELIQICSAVLDAGADFLKTSTGFGPRGASLDDVRLLVDCAGGRAKVKAAGGIRSRADAEAFLAAGASRLGTSSGVAILHGISGASSY